MASSVALQLRVAGLCMQFAAIANILSEANTTGLTESYNYDSMNRLHTVTAVQGTGPTASTDFSEQYHYDDNGLLEDTTTYETIPYAIEPIVTTYTYDALGRVIGEATVSQWTDALGNFTDNSYTNTYTYDLNSNRMEMNHVTPDPDNDQLTTYAYDDDDQLSAQTSDVSGITTYIYDANGSQIEADSTAGGPTVLAYNYDVRNQLSSDVLNNVTKSTYVYDDASNRVQETVGGTTTFYLTDTNNPTGYAQPIEAKTNPAAGARPTMTYIIGDRVLAQAVGLTQPAWIIADAHGDTRQITVLGGGLIAATFNYDAFGTGTNFSVGSTGTIDLFGGDAVFDPTSKLYLHGDGVRPSQGFRFIQEDGQGYNNPYNPVTNNLYLLDDADAVNGRDPSGHDSALAAAALGRAVHSALANDFREKLGAFGVSGQSIVTVLSKLGPLTNFVGPITSRLPDLLDIDPKNKEVFEIKPANLRAITAGIVQLGGYVWLLNKLDPTGGWHAGDAGTYLPPLELTILDPEDVEDPLDVVVVTPPEDGIITYSSIAEFVKQRIQNVAEVEDAEIDAELGIDILEDEIGGI